MSIQRKDRPHKTKEPIKEPASRIPKKNFPNGIKMIQARNVRARRLELGMDLKTLADHLGVERSFCSLCENPNKYHYYSPGRLEQVAIILETTYADLCQPNRYIYDGPQDLRERTGEDHPNFVNGKFTGRRRTRKHAS